MKKLVATIVAFMFLASGVGLGFAIASYEPAKSYSAGLSARGSYGRHYDVSSFSALIDADKDAMVIQSEGNSLRFEESRLLIDGYHSCDLTPGMEHFDVRFSEQKIVVSVDGQVIVNQSRENQKFASLHAY